jgi:hypothetical protein
MRIMPRPCKPGESSASPEIIASNPIKRRKTKIMNFNLFSTSILQKRFKDDL